MLDTENIPDDERTRRDKIAATLSDLVGAFVYYDRKEDSELPRGAIEDAVQSGEVTLDELVDAFRCELVRVGVLEMPAMTRTRTTAYLRSLEDDVRANDLTNAEIDGLIAAVRGTTG